MKRPSSAWKPGENEAGSTAIETLIAVLILAIVGAAALGAVSGGTRSARAAGRSAITAARALAADDALRRAVGRIRVPYWERQERIETTPQTALLAYWDGEREKTLRIEDADGSLSLTTPEGVETLAGVELVAAGPIPEGNAPPRGLRVEYRVGGRDFTTTAAFGAWALGKGSP